VEQIDNNSFTLVQFTQGLSEEEIEKQKQLTGRDITNDASVITNPDMAK